MEEDDYNKAAGGRESVPSAANERGNILNYISLYSYIDFIDYISVEFQKLWGNIKMYHINHVKMRISLLPFIL